MESPRLEEEKIIKDVKNLLRLEKLKKKRNLFRLEKGNEKIQNRILRDTIFSLVK